MSAIMIFDTETTSLEKPFCYNIGYTIRDEETFAELVSREFVVEQVWYNEALFASAYYADKRPIYVNRMRGRKIEMRKYGHIMRRMIADIKAFEVVGAYAYNSGFDEKVFAFNCDWYKCNNPFDAVPIFDIRGYAHHFLCGDVFKEWCEEFQQFTETGNYSTSAETLFRFVGADLEFIEEHTALSDSMIEADILQAAIESGATLGEDYKAFRSLPRETPKPLTIKIDGRVIFKGEYLTKYERKNDGLYNFRTIPKEKQEG